MLQANDCFLQPVPECEDEVVLKSVPYPSVRGEEFEALLQVQDILTTEAALRPEFTSVLDKVDQRAAEFKPNYWTACIDDCLGADEMFRLLRVEVEEGNEIDSLAKNGEVAILLHESGYMETCDVGALSPKEGKLSNKLDEMDAEALCGELNADESQKIAEVEQHYRRVLKWREEHCGPLDPTTFTSMSDLAILLQACDVIDESEELFRRAIKGREAVLGKFHLDTIETVNNLAWLLESQGRVAEAEPLYRRSYECYEATLGFNHPDTLGIMYILAAILQELGQKEEAEELFKQERLRCRLAFGPGHSQTLGSVNNLSGILRESGKVQEADDVWLETEEGVASFQI